MANILEQLFGGSPLGSVSQDVEMKKIYDQLMVEAVMQGQTLPPFEEWVKMQTGRTNAGQPYQRPN